MLSERHTLRTLDRLCHRLGICLSAEAKAQVVAEGPPTQAEFLTRVLKLAGLDARTIDSQLRKQVREIVAHDFAEADEPRLPLPDP